MVLQLLMDRHALTVLLLLYCTSSCPGSRLNQISWHCVVFFIEYHFCLIVQLEHLSAEFLL